MLNSVNIFFSFRNIISKVYIETRKHPYVTAQNNKKQGIIPVQQVFQQQVIHTTTLCQTKIFLKIVIKDLKPNFGLGQMDIAFMEVNIPHIKWNTTMQIHQNRYFSFNDKLYLLS